MSNKLLESNKTVRWTVGPVSKAGINCLERSIESFCRYYTAKMVICHNCDDYRLDHITSRFPVTLHNQSVYLDHDIKPIGVAWKLYPTRLAPEEHEIQIDNDIIFESRVDEIDEFFAGDCTLLLQGSSRNYGKFGNHVPPGMSINSGIFGMPPGFSMDKYFQFYITEQWEENATGKHRASRTFDEQGFVALALLSYPRYIIIPETTVTNCEHNLIKGKGLHFVGLNRNNFHKPYRIYKSKLQKLYL